MENDAFSLCIYSDMCISHTGGHADLVHVMRGLHQVHFTGGSSLGWNAAQHDGEVM